MKYRIYDITNSLPRDPMHAPLDECPASEIEAHTSFEAARGWVEEQSFTENSNYEIGTLLIVDSHGDRFRRQFVFSLKPEITITKVWRPPSR